MIKLIENKENLCHKKPQTDEYFPVFIELDFEDKTVTYDWSVEQNSIPDYVFNNKAIRFTVPSNLSNDAINDTVTEFMPKFENLLNTYVESFSVYEKSYYDCELLWSIEHGLQEYIYSNFDSEEYWIDWNE